MAKNKEQIREQTRLGTMVRMFYEGYTLYEIGKAVDLEEKEVQNQLAIILLAGLSHYKNCKKGK